jgi:regulator of replication initiation timing
MSQFLNEVTKAIRVVRDSKAQISNLQNKINATKSNFHDLGKTNVELRLIAENHDRQVVLDDLNSQLENKKKHTEENRQFIYQSLKEFNGRNITLSVNQDNDFTDNFVISFKNPINDVRVAFTLSLNGTEI